MSVKCLTWVFENSSTKGNQRLLMLSLADNADDNGFSWPGKPKLASKVNCTERTIVNLTADLEASGDLIVYPEYGMKTKTGKTNLYKIVMPGINDGVEPDSPVIQYEGREELAVRQPRKTRREVEFPDAGVKTDSPHGVKTVSPEPSLEPSLKEKDSAAVGGKDAPAGAAAGAAQGSALSALLSMRKSSNPSPSKKKQPTASPDGDLVSDETNPPPGPPPEQVHSFRSDAELDDEQDNPPSEMEAHDLDVDPPQPNGGTPVVDAKMINELIAAWYADAKVIVRGGNPFKIKGYRANAEALAQNGITSFDVQQFIKHLRKDKYWSGKGITWTKVVSDILAWKENQASELAAARALEKSNSQAADEHRTGQKATPEDWAALKEATAGLVDKFAREPEKTYHGAVPIQRGGSDGKA